MIDKRTSQSVVDPWEKTGHRFRAFALISLIGFGGFALYDSRAFYARYVQRCEIEPDRPECFYLNGTRPKRVPDLGIAMDNESGRWALQLEATDERTAEENAAQLRSIGANPRLVRTTGRAKTALYYIQLGRFKSQKDAFSANSQLKAKGVTLNFVVARYRPESK
jgi:hypothetical protein